MTTLVGAVLVGGASSRMGTPKALLPLDDTAMARRVVDALLAGGASRVAAAGGEPSMAAALGIGHRADRWPGEGPLGGLTSAVLGEGGDDVIVVVAACDQPDLTGELVRRLVEALEGSGPEVLVAAVVTSDGRRHPFPSAWRAAAGPVLEALMGTGARRADAGFDAAGVVDVPADPAILIDLDTPDDVRRWARAHGSPPPGFPGIGPADP
jgi:molybdopterin-guanine dinucleotide biosynthesis protein A